MTLKLIGDRWHCDGLGLHTGDRMEMRFTENEWLPARIEIEDQGRLLFGHFNFHGKELRWRIYPGRHSLRWPVHPAPADEAAMQDPQQELLALARLVNEMRNVQRIHFQTHSLAVLDQSKNFEKLVDTEVKRILDGEKILGAISAV